MGAFHPTRVKGRRGRCGSWDRLCSERQDPIRRPKNVLGWRVPGNVEYRLWSARLAAPGTARLVCCQCGRAEPVIELVLHRPEVVGSVDAQVRPLRGIDSQEVIGVLVSSLIAEASRSRRRRPGRYPRETRLLRPRDACSSRSRMQRSKPTSSADRAAMLALPPVPPPTGFSSRVRLPRDY
jgi:hypothetical protein